jgi:hypothetical protein
VGVEENWLNLQIFPVNKRLLRRLTGLGCGILDARLLQVYSDLDEEESEGVDYTKDDPVADKAADHHQPGLKDIPLSLPFYFI